MHTYAVLWHVFFSFSVANFVCFCGLPRHTIGSIQAATRPSEGCEGPEGAPFIDAGPRRTFRELPLVGDPKRKQK